MAQTSNSTRVYACSTRVSQVSRSSKRTTCDAMSDACSEHTKRELSRNGVEYSIPDQVARFANAKATNDARYLDITTVYDGSSLKGQNVLITGAEQGLGLELVKEILAQGGKAVQAGRSSSADLDKIAADNPGSVQIITGVDVTSDEAMKKMTDELKENVDIVINSAGYFYGPAESVGVECEGHMNFKQQMLQIDICALGPLRITHALYKAGKIGTGGNPGKVIIITSQAGSCEWRFTQNPTPKPGDEFHGAPPARATQCLRQACPICYRRLHSHLWRLTRAVVRAVDAMRGGRQLRAPYEPSGHQHHGRDPLPGAQGRKHPHPDAAPGLQPHGDDPEVLAHLGHRGGRRAAHRREARPVRDDQGRHVHLRHRHQLRGRQAHPVVSMLRSPCLPKVGEGATTSTSAQQEGRSPPRPRKATAGQRV